MTFSTMTRGHLLVAASELRLCAQAIERALQDQDQQHTLPGHIHDAGQALTSIVAAAGGEDASFAQALANGMRSTVLRALPLPDHDADVPGFLRSTGAL